MLAEYDPVVWDSTAFEQRRLTKSLLRCAAQNGLAAIDSFSALAAAPEPRQLYGRWHMNATGNLLIAKLIATALKSWA